MGKINNFFNHSFTAYVSAFLGSWMAISMGGHPPAYSKNNDEIILSNISGKSDKASVSYMETNPTLKKEFYSLENLVMDKFEKQKIPVLMFHQINNSGNRYSVSPDNFRYMLDRLHRNDYFALNLEQFSTGDLSEVPVGKKPFLITFDDANDGQFEYKYGDIDPDCAVGILEEFFNKKKDFGKGAVFFESYFGVHDEYIEPFEGDMKKKNDFLLENGYDIGSHTPVHNNNRDATRKDIREQTMVMDALLQYHTTKNMEEEIKSYAHPYGAVPRNPFVDQYLKDQHDVVMLAVGGMSPHPLSDNFDVKAVPRIEADMSTLYAFMNRKEQYVVGKMDKLYYEAKFKNKKPYFEMSLESKPLAKVPGEIKIEQKEKIDSVKHEFIKIELPDSKNDTSNYDVNKGITDVNSEQFSRFSLPKY